MASPTTGTDLIAEDELVLPDHFRPYTPPGAKPVQIPTRIKKFRPLLEHHPDLRQSFDPFFRNTRQAAADRAGRDAYWDHPENTVDVSFPRNPLPVENPAEKAATHDLSDVFIVEDDGRRRFMNLEENPDQEGTYFALDDRDIRLLSDQGGDIITDENGFELPKKPGFFKKMGQKIANSDGRAGEDDNPIVYTKEGIPIGDFDVVSPGHAPSDGRGKRGVRALGIAVSALGIVAALGLVGGVLVGRSAVPAEGQITAEEATTYGLSRFPVDAGAAFAEHYLTLCLTHPQYREDTERRAELMAGMEAPGVPENCGWESGGAPGAPTSVTFNGEVEERPEYGDGNVAYLGYFVTMQDGRHFTATVPVWAGDNGAGRPAYSIVGTVGMTASTAVMQEPDMTLDLLMDRQLASELSPILETFFTAWGESDNQTLDSLLATGTDGDARVGLNGTVSDPQINNVVVYPVGPPAEISGQNAVWDYTEGDTVNALVSLTWSVDDEAGGRQQPTGYRIPLVYQAGKWEVNGLQAGVVVPDGTSSSGETDPAATVGGAATSGGSLGGEEESGDSPAASGGFSTLEEQRSGDGGDSDD